MKKLLLIILLGSVLVFSDISLASEDDGIILKTTNVSEDVKKYATDNLSFYLKTMLIADGITGDLNEYVLGTPFSLLNNETSTDTIIFPILKGDNLIYNFYVQETDGEYVTKVTKELVDELNGLRKKNINHSISLISANNGDIYYEINGQIELLWINPENFIERVPSESPEHIKSKINNLDLEEIDLTDETTYEMNVDSQIKKPNLMSRSVTTDRTGTHIDWKISETQGKNSWCTAYAAAMILNNKNDVRKTSVSDMVKWANKPTDKGFSEVEVVKYANTRGVYPKMVSRTLSVGEILTEVRKSNGVLGVWQSQVNTWHAIDIIGNFSERTLMGDMNGYMIWNPWREYVEVVDSSPKEIKYVASSDRTYTWRRSIINW